MRTDIQLIQSAISDNDYKAAVRLEPKDHGDFKLYKVVLPKKYRGLYPIWHFAIIGGVEKSVNPEDLNKIINDATLIIKQSLVEDLTPLILISDHLDIDFSNYLEYPDNNIFFLKKTDLPGKDNFPNNLKNAPFIRAVRNKFDAPDLPKALFTIPYRPNKPVKGWKFFGRKKEIEKVITSSENFFVVGPRKVGKTSFLREVELRLKNLDFKVHFLSVESCSTQEEVIEKIALKLSSKEVARLRQHMEVLGGNYLTVLLKILKGNNKRFVIILDELGNVIAKNPKDDWKLMGALRELSHAGEIRVIISAFQEVLIKQHDAFDGPYINFGSTLRLKPFSNAETEEFLIAPLEFWGRIENKNSILDLVTSRIGTQPFILQLLGDYLVRQIFSIRNQDVKNLIDNLLESDEIEVFEDAFVEAFESLPNSLPKYIFISFCKNEEDKGNLDISKVEFSDNKVLEILDRIEIESLLDERKFLLGQLEMHGLIQPDYYNRSIYKIVAPIIYTYIRRFYNPIEHLIRDLETDIRRNKNMYMHGRLI